MSQARCNARRRQAANNFAHMSGDMRRPHYKRSDTATAAKRLQRVIERERERKARGAKG